MDQEAQIQEAIRRLNRQEKLNYSDVARDLKLSRTLLMRRHKGETASRQEAISRTLKKLNNTKELALLLHIEKLTLQRTPPTPAGVRNITQEICGQYIGHNWVTRFISVIKLIYALEKYKITWDKVWSWDEKGFVMGVGRIRKRIMTIKELYAAHFQSARRDGNREWISCLACINATGKAMAPVLIYKGESGDLRDIWLQDFKEGDTACFATSANGWTTNALGIKWLELFIRYTKPSRNAWRLLLVDGHSSHVNLAFLELAKSARIIVLILPPHSTHKLQPLDVGLFSPLSTAYSKQLDKIMMSSGGLVSMSKQFFFGAFKPAWIASFMAKNITSAFAATGIFPYNPDITIAPLRSGLQKAPETPIKTNNRIFDAAPPLSVHAMSKVSKLLTKQDPVVEAIITGAEQIAADHSCVVHQLQGALEALRLEKKRRNQGKRINLLGEADHGPQIFTPSKIALARRLEDERAQKAEEEQLAKEEARLEALKKKELEKRQKAERALARAANKQLRDEAAAAEKIRIAAKKAEQKERKEREEAQKSAQQASKMSGSAKNNGSSNGRPKGGVSIAKRGRLKEPGVTTAQRAIESSGSTHNRGNPSQMIPKEDAIAPETTDNNHPTNGGPEEAVVQIQSTRGRTLKPTRFYGD